MLDIYKKELKSRGMFTEEVYPLLDTIASSVPNDKIPKRMKLLLGITELTLIASHLRKHILHWNNSIIPINTISFSFAKSGAGKDSAVNAIRKGFRKGYTAIELARKNEAKKKAIELARLEGEANYAEWSVYKDYYTPPAPLFIAAGTAQGFMQHLNDIEENPIGAGYFYDGEFSTTLQNSGNITEVLKLLAEVYDEGSKEAERIKNREGQLKAVIKLPVSALLVSSADNILYDENNKNKFKLEFSSKLARRSIFFYTPYDEPKKQYKSATEALNAELAMEDKAIKSKEIIETYVYDTISYHLESESNFIKVSKEVRELFTFYKMYNEEYAAKKIPKEFPIATISREHMQWKTLKLSGAIAIFEGSDIIEAEHYIYASNITEMLSEDLMLFEKELNKEEYEIFADFVHLNLDLDNSFYIDLHKLRKLGYIPKTGNPTTKLKELIQLVSSYDPSGIYTLCENGNGICYEKTVVRNSIFVSIKEFTDEELENL